MHPYALRLTKHFVSLILFAAVVVLGILTFGQPLLFDRIYVITLAICAIYAFGFNVNLFGLIGILLFTRLIEEALWLVTNETWWFRGIIYIIGLGLFYGLRYSKLARVGFVLIFIAAAINLYWYFSDYPAPQTTWFIIMLSLTQVTRHLLFTRPFLMERWFSHWGEVKWQRSDREIYKLFSAFVFFQLFILVEYFVRHLSKTPDLLWVYNSYSYIGHALSCLVLWRIIVEALKTLKLQLVQA